MIPDHCPNCGGYHYSLSIALFGEDQGSGYYECQSCDWRWVKGSGQLPKGSLARMEMAMFAAAQQEWERENPMEARITRIFRAADNCYRILRQMERILKDSEDRHPPLTHHNI